MESEIFARNRETLLRARPELWQRLALLFSAPLPGTIVATPSGLPNLKLPAAAGGEAATLHPLPDPRAGIAECLAMLEGKEGQIIFLLGFGLGYEALAICEKYSFLNQIKIIDADGVCLAHALQHLDLRPLLENPNVQIFLGPDPEELGTIVRHLDRWYLLHHPPYLLRLRLTDAYHPEYFQTVNERLYRLINAQQLQSMTTIRQARVMLDNAFHNLSTMVEGLPLDHLKNLGAGRPAVIVSGGPSLKKNLHLLKGQESHALLIAVDTAIPRLMAENITPHLICAMDHRERNADSLWDYWERLAGTGLVFLSTSTPLIPKFLPGSARYHLFDEAPANQWFNEMLGNSEPVGNISTVALLALITAARLGCDPIIMIGQDLAYEKEFSAEEIREQELVPVAAGDGRTIYTTHQFLGMIERFETQLAGIQATVINATEGGARLQHTQIMRLSEALATFCVAPVSLPPFPGPVSDPERLRRCFAQLAETEDYLKFLKKECREVIKNAGWAYDYLEQQSRTSPAVTVTDKLADAVNTASRKHLAIAGNEPAPEHRRFAPILDMLMGERRLQAHRQIIAWKKKHPELAAGNSIAKILNELQVHRLLCQGLLEEADYFADKIRQARQRLKLKEEAPLPPERLPARELLKRGNILLAAMDIHQAGSCFDLALAKGPNLAEAFYGKGRVQLYLREFQEAMANFQRACELAPSFRKRVQTDIAALSAALLEAAKDRISRNRPGARRFLGNILPEFPDYEEAQKILLSLPEDPL